jgi:hypothetical protein
VRLRVAIGNNLPNAHRLEFPPAAR